ncbi:hypothetical protein [Sapientia aquatica]|nr:hypothetical protein [Sapientia aquatica]
MNGSILTACVVEYGYWAHCFTNLLAAIETASTQNSNIANFLAI